MRKSHPAFRLATAEEVREHLQFIENTPAQVVAYTLNGNAGGDEWNQIVVAFNGSSNAAEIEIPEGNWMVIANDGNIDLAGPVCLLLSVCSTENTDIPAFLP